VETDSQRLSEICGLLEKIERSLAAIRGTVNGIAFLIYSVAFMGLVATVVRSALNHH